MHALRIKDSPKEKAAPAKPVQDNPVEELTDQVRTSVASGDSRERGNGVNATARLGNPLWGLESTARVVRRQAWQAETSESRTSTAESGSFYNLQQQRKHPVADGSPHDREKREKRLPQANLSPSPNSRLSSGFGSLQEDDDTLCESSYNQAIARRNATQQSLTSPRSSVSTDVPYSHTTSRQAVALSSFPENTVKVTKPSSTRNIITSQTESSRTRHEPLASHTPNERKIKTQIIRNQCNPLSPTSPPFEQHHVSMPVSSTSPSVEQRRAFKPLSPTDERALQQLKERQVQLQRSREERQKLTSNVQLLDLRVQEEELR